MGKLQPTGGSNFTITYGGLESPITGIDATKQTPIYLDPTAVATAYGFQAVSGYLSSLFLNPVFNLPALNNFGTTPAFAFGDIQVLAFSGSGTTPPNQITRTGLGFLIVSTPGSLNIYEYPQGFAANTIFTNVISIAANQASNISFKIVNGVVYITGLGFGAIYAYTPGPAGTSSITQLTNFIGGQFIGELNGRLVVLAVDQIVAGVYSYFPFQINWSGATGAYGVWNPTISGLVTGAGFNQLPDVADEITGFLTVGPTGYIIRKQGVTEITPLNSGIQPFDFNHLWASDKGIGSIYPETVCQYGSLGAFISDTGAYTIGYGGVNTIQGRFWGAINAALEDFYKAEINYQNVIFGVSGGLSPIYIAQERNLYYILYIPSPTTQGQIFIGNVLTQDWAIVPGPTIAQTYFNNGARTKIKAISNSSIFANGADQSTPTIGLWIPGGNPVGSVANLSLLTISDTTDVATAALARSPWSPILSLDFSFPIEEVGMFKDITINSIGIFADSENTGTTISTLTLLVTGISDPNNAPNGSTDLTVSYNATIFNKEGQFSMAYPVGLAFTGKYPQLQCRVSVDGSVDTAFRLYKIVLFCSYDQQQRP